LRREGLAALALRLGPEDAARSFNALVPVLGRERGDQSLRGTGEGLEALASRLGPADAARALDALVAVLGKTKRWDVLHAAGQGLAGLAPRLGPADVPRALDALVALLLRNTDAKDVLRAAGQGLAALALRLGPADAARAFDALVAVLGKATNESALRAAGQGLAALAPRLQLVSLEQRYEAAATTLVGRIQLESDSPIMDLVSPCIALLSSPPLAGRTELRKQLLVAVLDRIDLGWRPGFSVFDLARLISDRALLARQLSRPGCVGVVRQALLLRLEELAFPPTPDEVAQSAVAGLLAPPASAAWSLTLAATRAPRPRHFRTLWDAVAWLKKHHPEIDLDAPPPPVRRAP
jgi:hypothetical protein